MCETGRERDCTSFFFFFKEEKAALYDSQLFHRRLSNWASGANASPLLSQGALQFC